MEMKKKKKKKKKKHFMETSWTDRFR